jgi:uncharacterized protein YecT (DUF1311 family)
MTLSRSTLIAASLFLCFACPRVYAYEDEPGTSWDFSVPYGRVCYNDDVGTPVSGIKARQCIAEALKSVDTEMNDLYGTLLSELLERQMLRDSQRAWILFRDRECKLRASGMEEGNARGTVEVEDSCLLDLTAKRIKDLKRLLDNLDCGGCPVRAAPSRPR